MSHGAEKNVKEDPLGFINIHSVAKNKKLERGPFGDKKFSKKSHSDKKIERGTL